MIASVADPKILQLIFATAYGRPPTTEEMPTVEAAMLQPPE